MNRVSILVKVTMLSGLMAVFGGLAAENAAAQSVRGSGIKRYSHPTQTGQIYFSKVAVDAWLDGDGVARGTISWQGDFPLNPAEAIPGGPSQPFLLDVTDLLVIGNMAWVEGVVISSVQGNANGQFYSFLFTDNSDIDARDEIAGPFGGPGPIDSGSYTVID